VKPRQPKKMQKPPSAVSQAVVPPSGAGPNSSESVVGKRSGVFFSTSSFERLGVELKEAEDGVDMVSGLNLVVKVAE
jgi:hypothetical protein